MALYGVFRGISMFLQIIYYALLAYCLLSWILPPHNKVMMFLSRVTDPLLRPIRSLLFRFFPRLPIDLSAIVLFLLLNLLNQLLGVLYRLIA